MDAVQIILIVISVLSACGSGYLVYQLRSQQHLSLKMIKYLSIGDLLYSLSNFIYSDNGDYIPYDELAFQEKIRCQIQGFMLEFSEMACFLFCLFLCYCMYISIIFNKNNLHVDDRYYQIIGWTVPLILAIIVTSTQVCGLQAYTCGFSDNNPNSNHNIELVAIEAALFFYLPLWLCNLANIYFIIKVILFFNALKQDALPTDTSQEIVKVPQNNDLIISRQITMNMLWYPAIMLLCWLPATIYSFSRIIGEPINWLVAPRIICADCLGLFNAIAYKINTARVKQIQQSSQEEIQLARSNQDQSVDTISSGKSAFIVY